jgi:hypothetical protein
VYNVFVVIHILAILVRADRPQIGAISGINVGGERRRLLADFLRLGDRGVPDACRLGDPVDDTRRTLPSALSSREDRPIAAATGCLAAKFAALDLPFLRRRFEMATRGLFTPASLRASSRP